MMGLYLTYLLVEQENLTITELNLRAACVFISPTLNSLNQSQTRDYFHSSLVND
jgi:hypothetical protein